MAELRKRTGRETEIEDAIIKHPGRLGFPGALAIRHCRMGGPTGTVDIVLLPRRSTVRLVLVEAKATAASDAASKVIGQLLMYYAGALTFGPKGLSALTEFATRYRERARGQSRVTPKQLCGISPPEKAWRFLSRGEKLRPNQVRMFVALGGGDPHRALGPSLEVLRRYHGLGIGVVIVQDGKIVKVHKPRSRKRFG